MSWMGANECPSFGASDWALRAPIRPNTVVFSTSSVSAMKVLLFNNDAKK